MVDAFLYRLRRYLRMILGMSESKSMMEAIAHFRPETRGKRVRASIATLFKWEKPRQRAGGSILILTEQKDGTLRASVHQGDLSGIFQQEHGEPLSQVSEEPLVKPLPTQVR